MNNPGIDIAERERTIIKYLSDAAATEAGGATVKAIQEHVARELGDTITRAAYYKVLDRMEATGKIERLRDQPERVYGLTPRLHIGNAITLDDVYEMLPYLSTSAAMAAVLDAQDYYEEHRHAVLHRAAAALLKENAIDLFARMLEDMMIVLRATYALYTHVDGQGRSELEEVNLEQQLQMEHRELEVVAYRYLSLPRSALNVPNWLQVQRKQANIEIPNSVDLREALSHRVFGGTFIRESDVSTSRHSPMRERLVVAGSDASMHAGALAIQTAQGYVEDSTDIITFNNAIVCVQPSRLSGPASPRRGNRGDSGMMVYSAPLTRQTIDDPMYKGMVLAPALYPDLSESDYEHMALCATDVVQFRVDEDVFGGKAYDVRPPHDQIPKPQVHLRDGTITPQEREFSHYNRPDRYGEMVREGIRLERSILERILAGGSRAPVFAGTVKSTNLRIFSRLLNWYIARGSRTLADGPIEPNWNLSRAAAISDNAAMTALLAALPSHVREGKYYTTCALLRQFPSLTEFFNKDLGQQSWLEYFSGLQKAALNENAHHGGTLPYQATIELQDDDYVIMCERADYVMFYIGHTGGEPPPMLPRYEFLTSLRDGSTELDTAIATRRVEEAVLRVVDAVDAVGLAADRDHNFLSGKTLVKILPFLIQQAHEYSKTLGHKLEAELKSIMVQRLIELKSLRSSAAAISIRPVTLRRYLERFARANEALPEPPLDEVR